VGPEFEKGDGRLRPSLQQRLPGAEGPPEGCTTAPRHAACGGPLPSSAEGRALFIGVPVCVPVAVRASPRPCCKERKQTTQTRDRGGGQGPRLHEPLRKKENRQTKGGMGGRHAATTQGFQGEKCVVLAVAHPRASTTSYLSSQFLTNSRSDLHATSRSSHSHPRPLFCCFILSLIALLGLVLRRRCRLPIPCSRCFSRSLRNSALLAAYFGPSSLSSSPRASQGPHFRLPLRSFASKSCRCSGPLSFRALVPQRSVLAPSGTSLQLTTGLPPRGRLPRLPLVRLYVHYVHRGSPSMP